MDLLLSLLAAVAAAIVSDKLRDFFSADTFMLSTIIDLSRDIHIYVDSFYKNIIGRDFFIFNFVLIFITLY